MTTTPETKKSGSARYVIVAVLVVGAFFGAYQFAQAGNGGATAAPTGAVTLAADPGVAVDPNTASGAGGAGGGCCGSTPPAGGVTGDPIEGAAAVSGDVQALSVDLSNGYYEPNVLKLKAGVPAEITFAQSAGCTGQVISKDLNFSEDLTTGAKTVKLPALDAGEYAFSCGMEMVFGKIVVE